MKIGIIGYGTVGKAVEYGFNSPNHSFTIVDQSFDGSVSQDVIDTDVVFVCLPTVADGMLDPYTTIEICNHLVYYKYAGLVVLKSPLPPGFLDLPNLETARAELRIVINPDSVGTVQPNRDFVEAPMIMIGADSQQLIDALKVVYEQSNVTKKWFMEMSANEAILMKLFTDVFLASKLVLMSEFSELLNKYSDRDWNDFACMMTHDTRIGRFNTNLPDSSGKKGYGGEYLPAVMNTYARAGIRTRSEFSTVAGAMTSNSLIRPK